MKLRAIGWVLLAVFVVGWGQSADEGEGIIDMPILSSPEAEIIPTVPVGVTSVAAEPEPVEIGRAHV